MQPEVKTNSLDNQLLVAKSAKVLGIRKIRDKFNEFKNVEQKIQTDVPMVKTILYLQQF